MGLGGVGLFGFRGFFNNKTTGRQNLFYSQKPQSNGGGVDFCGGFCFVFIF